MKNIIINHWETIISISAFILSLINTIYLLFSNKKHIDFVINSYSSYKVKNKTFYIFNIEIYNKSRLPISITNIIFNDIHNEFQVIKSPRLILEKEKTQNSQIKLHQELHSAKFPININGLSSIQSFIVMYGSNDYKNLTSLIKVCTNRGKIKKHINFNNLYYDDASFRKETFEYYD